MRRNILVFIVLLSISLCSKISANYPYWEQRQSMFELLPVDSTDIVFLGNSLTDGGKWSEMFNMPNIKNRGIVSDVIAGVAQRTKCITSGKPAKIFLLIGVNDISHHITADSIATAVEKLVMQLKEETPTTKIYLQSYLPINNDFGVYKTLTNESETILKCNVLLEQVAKRTGAEWINIFPYMIDRDCKMRAELTPDGLHLYERGYCVWRDCVAPYIAPGVTFTDEAYPIPENSIMLAGNSLMRKAEWQELLANGNVRARGTWDDTVQQLPILVGNIAWTKPQKMLIQPSYDSKTENGAVSGNFNADSIVAYTEKAISVLRERSPKTTIYLQGLIPVNSGYEKYASFAGSGKAIKQANKKLQKLAKKLKINWIDVTPILSDSKGELKEEFTNDGYSLMGAGYKAWADAIATSLE
ncbi:MAG: hypothetical protein J1F10_01870 [Muribaculaceae bacterium]|nr:hypothetical protein [Muribaculaceae bacterium]